jgi:hypothetical protein
MKRKWIMSLPWDADTQAKSFFHPPSETAVRDDPGPLFFSVVQK